jgi:hypothetical protein
VLEQVEDLWLDGDGVFPVPELQAVRIEPRCVKPVDHGRRLQNSKKSWESEGKIKAVFKRADWSTAKLRS